MKIFTFLPSIIPYKFWKVHESDKWRYKQSHSYNYFQVKLPSRSWQIWIMSVHLTTRFAICRFTNAKVGAVMRSIVWLPRSPSLWIRLLLSRRQRVSFIMTLKRGNLRRILRRRSTCTILSKPTSEQVNQVYFTMMLSSELTIYKSASIFNISSACNNFRESLQPAVVVRAVSQQDAEGVWQRGYVLFQ